MAQTLDEFVRVAKEEIYRFETWWRTKHEENPEHVSTCKWKKAMKGFGGNSCQTLVKGKLLPEPQGGENRLA